MSTTAANANTEVAEPSGGPFSAADDPAVTPVIELHGARVVGPRGNVFGPVTAASRGPVTVIHGSRGSGRTALLLALAGRMRLDAGTLVTLGMSKPAEIRRVTGIVGFTEIDALEPAVTVGEALGERVSWALPWYRRSPRVTPDLSAELLGRAFGDITQPTPEKLVRDLNPVEEMLMRVSLALIDEPEMLLLDDFDALRDPADRVLVAERLMALAGGGIHTVISTTDPGDAALFAAQAREVPGPEVIEL